MRATESAGRADDAALLADASAEKANDAAEKASNQAKKAKEIYETVSEAYNSGQFNGEPGDPGEPGTPKIDAVLYVERRKSVLNPASVNFIDVDPRAQYTLYLVVKDGDLLPGDTLEFARFVKTSDRNHFKEYGLDNRVYKKGWVKSKDTSMENYPMEFSLGDREPIGTTGYSRYQVRMRWYSSIINYAYVMMHKGATARYTQVVGKRLGIAIVRDGRKVTGYMRFKVHKNEANGETFFSLSV